MTNLGVLGLMLALATGFAGCSNDVFTSDPLFTSAGAGMGLGDAGAAGAAPADPGSAGASGEAAGASGASGGPTMPAGGSGGAGSAAGTAGALEPAGGAGGAPAVVPPCQNAIDTPSHGYLALQKDTCYRTPDVFDTLSCGGIGWAARTIRVNGALATCDTMSVFPPQIGGYTYIEITGGEPGADWLRWSESSASE